MIGLLSVYEKMTLGEFNDRFGTSLDEGMSLDAFTDEIEGVGEVTYYYASYRLEDISDMAIEEGYELSTLFVYLIGDVYIATSYSL